MGMVTIPCFHHAIINVARPIGGHGCRLYSIVITIHLLACLLCSISIISTARLYKGRGHRVNSLKIIKGCSHHALLSVVNL